MNIARGKNFRGDLQGVDSTFIGSVNLANVLQCFMRAVSHGRKRTNSSRT